MRKTHLGRIAIVLAALLCVAAPVSVALGHAEAGLPPRARALRDGDRGEAVAALQAILETRGFDPGPIDGIFGPLTERAVRAAQVALGLTVDGLAGNLTVGALAAQTRGADTLNEQLHMPVAAATRPEAIPVSIIRPELVFHTPLTAEPGSSAAVGGDSARFALTFSGDPVPELLPEILSALDKHKMKATFFISGRMAQSRPELVQRIAAAGHEVGSAGFDSIDMSRLTLHMARAQLIQSAALIKEVTGVSPAFFRPPLGRFTDGLVDLAHGAGQSTALWSNPFAGDGPDFRLAEAQSRVLGSLQHGAVLMLHQDRPGTALALDPFLASVEAAGYQSVKLSRLTTCETCR